MIQINTILEKISFIDFKGNKNSFVNKPIQLDLNNTDANALMWVNSKNIDLLKEVNIGTIVCGDSKINYNGNCNYIISANPRLTFMQVIREFFDNEIPTFEISENSNIHPSVILGRNVTIGNFVVIESGCIIGDNTSIGHNNSIMRNTIIGENVKIGNNNTIGGVGFGYEKNEDGSYELLPHIGNVIINDFVEIGNNTTIDRAVLGSTLLKENCKVDNLVHIAHGVVIGQNSLIIANAMIGGSTIIGDNVWFAPSASILQKKTIGNNATIGMGAVVLKDVLEGEIIIGNPGKPLEKN